MLRMDKKKKRRNREIEDVNGDLGQTMLASQCLSEMTEEQ
jgi:hypothetical protein